MNREDIIRMALEAGATSPVTATIMLADESVIRFAALVAAASEAKEREAMVEEAAKKGWAMRNEDAFEDAVREIAAIRARGQA